MNIAPPQQRFQLAKLSRTFNHPAVTIGAVAVALILGASRHPLVQYLRPSGDFYLALLQMCVLPFLLTTIPLAVRSSMTSETVGAVMRGLVICIAGRIVVVALVGVLVPSLIFHFDPIDGHTMATIGALIGNSADRVDVEFALDLSRATVSTDGGNTGLMALVPPPQHLCLSVRQRQHADAGVCRDLACLGLDIHMSVQEVSDLRLNGLLQQGMCPAA